MASLTVSVPNLISGISQQPDSLRFPTQAERQVNAYASVVDGLIKRHPSEHVAKLYDAGDEESDYQTFPIRGTNGTDYLAHVTRFGVRVFKTEDGTEVPVYSPVFNAEVDPRFTYLATRAPNQLEVPETFDLASNDWAKAGTDAQDPAVSSFLRGPFDFKTGVLVGNGGAASDPAEYLNDSTWVGDKVNWFTVYVKWASGTPADSFQIELEDQTGTLKTWTASYSIDGSGVVTDDGTTTAGAVSILEDVGDEWYRVGIGVDPDDAANSGVIDNNDALLYTIRVQDTATFPTKFMYIWGAQLTTNTTPGTAPDYFAEFVPKRFVTIQDTTIVANPTFPVAIDTELTDSDTDDGHAFFFVRQGSFKTSYFIDIAASGLPLTTVQTDTWDGAAAVGAEISTVKTEDIANDLATQLNALAGVTASNVGSVVRVQYANAFTTLEARDSQGDTALIKVHKTIDNFESLPLICRGGYKIAVTASPETITDDYYVEFVADGGATTFGNGYWVESTPFDTEFKFDDTTMPHQLQPFVDSKFGSFTGTPNQEYFLWSPVSWEDRLAGDENSNPNPSFVSTDDEQRFIKDVFFFKGRLGFLSGENVILSEASRFFSFWRTSVRVLIDADPIDISASQTRSAPFHTALPFNERLIVFSSLGQSIMESGNLALTPTTAALTPVLEFENLDMQHPFSTGRGIYFPYEKGAFSGVREMFPIGEGLYFDTEDTTAQVPRYLEGEVLDITGTALENVVLVRTDADLSKLYVHKFFNRGQEKIQSAWFQYDFGSGAAVRGAFFLDNTLFLTIDRTEGTFLERMTIADGVVDLDASYQTHLDRRISDETTGVTPTYDIVSNTTEFTLPYDIESGDTMQIVTRQTGAQEGGIILQIDSIDTGTPGAHTITVNGDQTSTPVWIGVVYTMEYEFSDAAFRVPTEQGSRVSTVEGRFQVRFGNVNFSESAYFKVSVTPLGGTTYEYEFSGSVVGSPLLIANELALESGRFRFPVMTRNTEVTVIISNNSPVPSRLLNAEWLGTYNTRFSR